MLEYTEEQWSAHSFRVLSSLSVSTRRHMPTRSRQSRSAVWDVFVLGVAAPAFVAVTDA
jgi:hypothetical protein